MNWTAILIPASTAEKSANAMTAFRLRRSPENPPSLSFVACDFRNDKNKKGIRTVLTLLSSGDKRLVNRCLYIATANNAAITRKNRTFFSLPDVSRYFVKRKKPDHCEAGLLCAGWTKTALRYLLVVGDATRLVTIIFRRVTPRLY